VKADATDLPPPAAAPVLAPAEAWPRCTGRTPSGWSGWPSSTSAPVPG